MKRTELYDILYRLVKNPSDRFKLYNFLKELTDANDRLNAIEFFKEDKDINKISNYFYSIDYNTIDYNFAYEYFKNKYFDKEELHIGCTVIGKESLVGRNFDYYYNDKTSFLLKTKNNNGLYSTIGIAGQLNNLTDEFINSRKYNNDYKLLPFILQDGINEKGLFACINVVPVGDKGITKGTIPTINKQYEVCMLMLVRFILDHYETVDQVIDELPKYVSVYAPYSYNFNGEYHFFIKDSEKAKIIEFINNEIKFIDCTEDTEFMTNFCLFGTTKLENGHINYNSVSDYGMGVERFNLIVDEINDISTKDDLLEFLETLKYTHSYDENTDWLTEFCGITKTFGSLTVKDAFESPNKFNDILEYSKNIFEHRSRDINSKYYGSWQTVHTSLYDVENKKLYIAVQEDYDNTYEFNF